MMMLYLLISLFLFVVGGIANYLTGLNTPDAGVARITLSATVLVQLPSPVPASVTVDLQHNSAQGGAAVEASGPNSGSRITYQFLP